MFGSESLFSHFYERLVCNGPKQTEKIWSRPHRQIQSQFFRSSVLQIKRILEILLQSLFDLHKLLRKVQTLHLILNTNTKPDWAEKQGHRALWVIAVSVLRSERPRLRGFNVCVKVQRSSVRNAGKLEDAETKFIESVMKNERQHS